MADVQIQQTPGERGSSSWVWAIVVLVLLAVVAWYLFAGRGPGDTTDIDINTNPPASPTTPPPSGGTTPPPTTPPPGE
jgi:hypothetical protein